MHTYSYSGEASSITDDSIPQVVSNSYDRVLFEDDVGQQGWWYLSVNMYNTFVVLADLEF